MRVIVAGATGTIGRPLVELLVAAGHEVVGVTRRPDAVRPTWSGAIVADVLDRTALLAAAQGIRADAVIHELTAIDGLPLRHRDLDATNRLRVQGTSNLLGLAEAVGARRMVTRSFLAGYGLVDHGTMPIAEGAPFGVPGSASPQARPIIEALKAAERLTRATLGIDGINLRYGLFYGPESLRAMAPRLRRRALPVPRSGGGVHSYVAVRDAAAATVAALERGDANAAYNVCDDRPVAWNDFFDAAARAVGAPRPLRVPSWFFRPTPYVADFLATSIPMSNARAKARLGWAPTAPTTEEGLRLAARSVS
ncbi:NAD-dependent epimerase/dehydratase family protein [Amnibacterium setariae]|uniref:NAD(P)-dependent oxidoreductase n=1 Tax=Amnibacterium setariae TaxID=2306585 RepID=A0A3A1TUE8_9MICO|nr:NAD(P)-dependent oxidoreductase [Amnibacterium setariae]RIX27883.1 NAD(P)-dependent oxidoreductase [Amnibacterium setariae]